MSQNALKNSFVTVVFQILAKIKMTQNKNRLFGRHSETVQHFNILFCRIMIFYSAYIKVRVQISSQNSAGKMVFHSWCPRTPLGTNGSESTLVT